MADYKSIYTGAQIDDILTPAYSELHTHDNSTAQAISPGTTYTKLINLDNVGIEANMAASIANSNITVQKAGSYRIEASFSFASGTNNVVPFITIFVNDIEIDSIHLSRKISTAGDVGNANLTGLLRLVSGDIVDVRMRHNLGSSVNFTFSYMNFNISREGI